MQVTLDGAHPAALASALAPLGWAPAVGARPDSPGVHRDLRHDDDTAPDEVFTKRLLVAPDPARPTILHVRLTAFRPLPAGWSASVTSCAPTHVCGVTTSG